MSFMSKLKLWKKDHWRLLAFLMWLFSDAVIHIWSFTRRRISMQEIFFDWRTACSKHMYEVSIIWGLSSFLLFNISEISVDFFPLKSIDLIWAVYLLQVMTTLCAYDSIQWRIFSQKRNIAWSQNTCNHS